MKSIYFSSLLFLFTGCGIQYYSVNMHNTPLLKEKGDLKINSALSASEESGDTAALEFQGAYAINEHWGMVADFHGAKEKYFNGTTNKGFSSTVGFGYFTALENSNWISETYGSIGGGHAIFKDPNMHYGEYANNYYVSWDRDYYQKHVFSIVAIQSNIGYKTKYLECALSGKITRLNYFYKEAKLDGAKTTYKYDVDDDPDGNTYVFLEPGIMFRGGGENFKIQTAFSLALGGGDLTCQRVNLSLGLQLSLNALAKAK